MAFPSLSALAPLLPTNFRLLLTYTALALLPGYLLLVRLTRFSRLNHIISTYSSSSPNKPLDEHTAWHITRLLAELETPYFSTIALELALFRTYAIPGIAALLSHTGSLTHPDEASKRIADTAVLIYEFVHFPPGSERSRMALARTNWIHARYATKVGQPELLYTLVLFATSPVRYIDAFDWRVVAPIEKEALYVFWRGVGERMGIVTAPAGARLEEWIAWAEEYEKANMRPYDPEVRSTRASKKIADQTINQLLLHLPGFAKPFGKNLIASVLDAPLRAAMGIPPPPPPLQKFVLALLSIRKWVVRNCLLPRPEHKRFVRTSPTEPSDPPGVYWWAWEGHKRDPWYVRPTFRNRWARVWTWVVWGKGMGYVDGVGWGAGGYRSESMGGGVKWEGRGEEVVKWGAERMGVEMAEGEGGRRVVLGCPFGGMEGKGERLEEEGKGKGEDGVDGL